jgi:predicted MFS family arabinose efflux permease
MEQATGHVAAQRVPLTTIVRGSGFAATEAASIIGRLGFCLWSSTALLYVSSQFGVEVAGYAVALFTVSAAVSAAPLCSFFEARGRSLAIGGVLALNACACVLVLAADHGQRAMALSGIALAGMSSLPTAAVMRSIWQRHSSPADVSRFQALESMITQVCVVVSPALVGFLAEGSFRVAAPLLASSCSCAGGALTWIWSRPHMTTAISTTSDVTRRGRVPGRLLAVFTIICASAMISGYFNISMAARFVGGTKFPDTAGTIIAGAAIGSIVGGFLFARLWRWPGTRWGYPLLMSAWTLALWLLAATGHGYAVLAVAFASGLPVTGIGAEEFGMLGRLASARPAWWFGLANMAISIGVGAGSSVGAQLVRFTDSGRFLPGIAATAVLAVSAVLWPALSAPKRTA